MGNKKPLNARRGKILAEIRDNPNITAEELRKILGISKTAVDSVCNARRTAIYGIKCPPHHVHALNAL